MPVDPAVQSLLDLMAAQAAPPLWDQPVSEARSRFVELAVAAAGEPEPVASVTDLAVAGPAGPIAARAYRPEGSPAAAVVYLHGGGWVIGSIATADSLCRALANDSGCAVLSVEYRLAPEHRYPAALDDAWAALEWLAGAAGDLGAPAGRVAVAGDSAGGNLAAALALRARDRSVPVAAQLLVYPVLDADLDRPSYRANAEGYFLTRDTMRWFWDQYVPDGGRRLEPEAAPLRAASLAGLAPAVVLTAEFDPLRDEGDEYAGRLAAAGVPVAHLPSPGMIHGFLGLSAFLPGAREALARAGRELASAIEARAAAGP